MTELEKMQRARDYIEKLASGIDPISGDTMGGDTILNNVRLSRCFFYISDILRQVIENGGTVGKRPTIDQTDLPPFALPPEMRRGIQITEDPAMIMRFAERVNNLIDQTAMRKIKATAFTSWLTEKGYLFDENINGKKRKKPTEAGKSLGITTATRDGANGQYVAVLYSENAQRFLIDNIDAIIEISNRDRTPEPGANG